MIMRTAIVLVLALIGAPLPSWASARHSQVATEIESLERAWSAAFLKHEPVAQIHRMQDGFQFVKAIGPPAEDVQQEVDLAG